MDKIIDLPYRSEEYADSNQLIVSDDAKGSYQSPKNSFTRKEWKREKRSGKAHENSSSSTLSKKKRKKLQRIVDLKARKQTRAELEKELNKYRSEKISRSSVSPVEIFSKNRYKERLKNRSKRAKSGFDFESETSKIDSDDESSNQQSPWPTCGDESQAEPAAVGNEVLVRKRAADYSDLGSPVKKKKKKRREKVLMKGTSTETSQSSADELDANETDGKEEAIPKSSTIKREPKRFLTVERSEELTKARESLPILSEEFAIMESLETNDVIVLTGSTGCGKTTQVPQFLYEAGFTENDMKIGITEPRRVAAISMSDRVACELSLTSREVSYQIRYEGNAGDETRIKFMTDGVLLQEIKSDFYLSSYSAIIVDEAHERSVYTDLLIGILSMIVRSRRQKKKSPLKVIIMSATLDAINFVKNKKLFPRISPSVVELTGRQHSISLHHLKRTPKDYLLSSYAKACELHRSNPEQGGILIFLTGAEEVQTVVRWLKRSFPRKQEKETTRETKQESKADNNLVPIKMDNYATIPMDEESDISVVSQRRRPSEAKDSDEASSDYDCFEDDDGQEIPVYREVPGVHVLPLYSLLQSERQKLVFEPPPKDHRLIVVSTNVAETSLTIPHIRFVIDCGRVKEKVYDRVTGVSHFSINWISKANAKQRAGRAGRTGPGHCYRLYSSQVYEDFEEHAAPEILRRPVEDIVLLLKNFMGRVNVSSFPFPNSPDKEALITAEENLIELGAIEKLSNGKTSITLQGRYMTNLPVAPRYAKILLLAYLQSDRSTLPYAILLVSALSIQELFNPRHAVEKDAPETEREKFENSFLKQNQSLLFGDFVLALGPVWWFCSQLDKNLMSESELRPLCEQYGLRWKAVLEVRKLRRHLTEAINLVFPGLNLSIDSASDSPPSENILLMLRQILLTVFPQHVARRAVIPPNASDKERRALKKAYFTTLVDGPVYIHPQSILCNENQDWILFLELHETTRTNMKTVMAVNPEWLPFLVSQHVRVMKPISDPCPKYDAEADAILCQAERIEFGNRGWGLPTSVWAKFPTEKTNDMADASRWFARLLMEGKIVPEMKHLVKKWMSSCRPSMITQPWGLVRPQVKNLLRGLGSITTKKELVEKWCEDPHFLWTAVSQWLPMDDRLSAEASWPPLNRNLRESKDS